MFLPRGAKLCVVKTKRKERHAETLTQDYIITRKEFKHNFVTASLAFSQFAGHLALYFPLEKLQSFIKDVRC